MFRVLGLVLFLVSCSSQEYVKILEGKEQTIGMKAYRNCKEAPKYLIFPKPHYEFTMKGVKFPVRIIGLKNGKVVYNKVHYPEEEKIRLPNTDLVLEVAICEEKKYGGSLR